MRWIKILSTTNVQPYIIKFSNGQQFNLIVNLIVLFHFNSSWTLENFRTLKHQQINVDSTWSIFPFLFTFSLLPLCSLEGEQCCNPCDMSVEINHPNILNVFVITVAQIFYNYLPSRHFYSLLSINHSFSLIEIA